MGAMMGAISVHITAISIIVSMIVTINTTHDRLRNALATALWPSECGL